MTLAFLSMWLYRGIKRFNELDNEEINIYCFQRTDNFNGTMEGKTHERKITNTTVNDNINLITL